MIQILNIDEKKFSLNGIPYFKNFTPVVYNGTNKVKIVNTYDSKLELVPYSAIEDFIVNGISYSNLYSLQNALLEVIYSRNTLASVNSILSSDNLSKAKRKDDVLYGIIDRYTGEEITLTKTLDVNPADGVIYFTIGSEKFKRNFTFLNVKWFGAKGDDFSNDTLAIQKAIDIIAFTGGTLFLPKGTYLHSGLNFTNVNNLSIEGENDYSEFQYRPTTILKTISACDVAINIVDDTIEIPTSFGVGIVVKNIYIYANDLAQVGINMCRSVKLYNVKVSHAITDGIVFTGGSYPLFLDHVVSQNNGRDGIRVKAPFTTVYSIKNTECGFNGGNGITIYDGSTVSLENVLCQSNDLCGFFILYQSPETYTYPAFLERFLFKNCYAEANGDYGIKIDSFNTDPLSFIGKISDFTFINCSFNSGVSKQVYIRGCALTTVISTPYVIEAISDDFNTTTLSEFNVLGKQKIRGLLDLSNSKAGNIKFPTTQNKSTNPKTLDDYEEGVFTAKLSQQGTIFFTSSDVNNGSYTKIGNLVTCFIDFTWTDKGLANDAFFCILSELPYFPLKETEQECQIIVAGGSSDKFTLNMSLGSKACFFRKNSNLTEFSKIIDFPTSGKFYASFTYLAD